MFIVAVFFLAITHITVINNNINDDKGTPEPITDSQEAQCP